PCFYRPPLRPLRPPLFPYTTLFRSNPVIAVKGVKRLVTVHLAISGGLGPLIQQERFDNLIGHFHKGVLGAERVILFQVDGLHRQDRKSTRLNSSHVSISYAVFCLIK